MKKIISLFITAAMLLTCVLPAFAAEFVPYASVIMDEDMSGVDATILAKSSTDTSDYYTSGSSWITSYGNSVGKVSVTSDGLALTTNSMTSGSAFTVRKKAFANAQMRSHTDLRLSVKLTTGTITDGMAMWFTLNRKGVQPFAYRASDLTLQFCGTNTTNWTPAVDENDEPLKFQLAENTTYTLVNDFVYNKTSGYYDMVYTLYDASGVQLGDSITVNDYTSGKTQVVLTDVADLYEIFLVSNPTITQTENKTYLTINNIKIENVIREQTIDFDNIKYNGAGVLIDEALIDFNRYAVKATTDASVQGGAAWGSEYYDHWTYNAIVPKSDYLWFGSNDAAATCGNAKQKWCGITKKFTPVSDGDSLSMTFGVKYRLADENLINISTTHFGFHVDLVDDSVLTDEKNSTAASSTVDPNLINVFSWTHNTGYKVSGMVMNNVGLGGTSAKNFDYTGYTVVDSAKNIASADTDLLVSLKLEPKDDTTYTCTINLTDVNGNPVYSTTDSTKEMTAVFDVSKMVVENLTRVRIYGVVSALNSAESDLIGIRNMKIESISNSTKTEITSGANTLYIPYTNATDNPFDAAVIAAVCLRDSGKQTRFYINKVNDVAKRYGNLSIDVNIEDPAKEYVRVFIFDSLSTVEPYTTSKSTLSN